MNTFMQDGKYIPSYTIRTFLKRINKRFTTDMRTENMVFLKEVQP